MNPVVLLKHVGCGVGWAMEWDTGWDVWAMG